MFAAIVLGALALSATVWAAPADDVPPRALAIPGPTAWRPSGCRSVPVTHPVLPSRAAFRRAHGDLESTNEVDLAYAPVFEREWIVEQGLYQVTTPAFDGDGNLYMTPLLPHEPILMLSLDPTTGARRFVVPLEEGDRGGGAVPLVLRDPDSGGEVVYLNRYDHMLAVRTDGSTQWDAPTGLPPSTAADAASIGLAYVPSADGIVGLTRDGFVTLVDRRTGAQLLSTPYQLPGEKTPPTGRVIAPTVLAGAEALLKPLIEFPDGFSLGDLVEVLLGGSSKVANNLSVDARTGRLWIATSAPDGEDGTVDGVSELGAIYRYDVVPDGERWALNEVCHKSFTGGSASTPTIGQNGTRVYLGDSEGALIALDAEDCGEAWRVPLDSQIFGSIGAASDGRELYAASASGIFQVFDDGDSGRRGFTAALDLYDVPAGFPTTYGGLNLLLTGIGANGLLIQAGFGFRNGTQALPAQTGIVHVDRLTGAPRWFAPGLEESLGAMSTGPDGALYMPHAPLRRAFAAALGLTSQPLTGGLSKWSSTRDDLVARDAACAAAARADNAATLRTTCPESAVADMTQVDALRLQMLTAIDGAVEDGTLQTGAGRRLRRLGAKARKLPADPTANKVSRYHKKAARALDRACRLLSSEE